MHLPLTQDTKLKEEIEHLNKELQEKATLLVMKDQEMVRKLQENDAEVQKILAEKEKEVYITNHNTFVSCPMLIRSPFEHHSKQTS